MARREKFRALVLSRRDINDADRLVTLFTRSDGLMRVIAKGVRRIPSRRGGHLEPLTDIVCIVNGSEGRRYLAAVETFNDYQELHKDEQSLSYMTVLVRALTRMFKEEEAQEELYDAFCQACELLPQVSQTKRDVLEVALHLLMLYKAGLSPNLKTCSRCKQTHPTDAIVLDATDGGWHCLTCHQSFRGTRNSLPAELIKVLRWLNKYPNRALKLHLELSQSQQVLNAMRSYMREVTETPLHVSWASSQSVTPVQYVQY